MRAAAAAQPRIARFDLRQTRARTAPGKQVRLAAATYAGAILCSVLASSSTETAVANGDTRTLSLYHSHTGESIEATFRVNGSYDPAVLDKLNWFLRDWRNNDRTRMDPRLFDVVWEVYRTAGAGEPIVIVSAYRSPETNAMLRRRSSAVAEHSQHILGKAMDTRMPGMSMEKIREIGMRLQRGGVGYYGNENFVHLDVGNVRSWPRMSYDQLARLFPDGKTVHLASNGRTLPRYEEARAEIASHGGVATDAPAPRSGGLFAWLFGNHDEDEDAEAARVPAARRGHVQVASLAGNTGARRPAAEAPTGAEGGGNLAAAGDRRNARAAPLAQPTPAQPIFAQPTPPALAATPPRSEPDSTPGPSKTVVANLSAAPLPPDRRAAKDQDPDAATASIAKDKIEHVSASTASAPLPPARPLEFIAFADAPVPPTRPEALTRIAALATRERADDSAQSAVKSDAIGGLIAASSALSPLARAANLPVVITQGPKDQASLPAKVLAYASGAQEPLASTPSKDARQQQKPSMVSARLDRSNFHNLTIEAAATSVPTQSILGQSITGLRQAARIIPDALSAMPSAAYVTSFGPAATTLDSAHFTGGEAGKIAPAHGVVSIVETSTTLPQRD